MRWISCLLECPLHLSAKSLPLLALTKVTRANSYLDLGNVKCFVVRGCNPCSLIMLQEMLPGKAFLGNYHHVSSLSILRKSCRGKTGEETRDHPRGSR